MQLEQIAISILYGTRWEDKLVSPTESDPLEDLPQKSALLEIPRFPGRPTHLSRFGKSEFPKVEQLKADSTRGKLLHFFANHELLAMELMALMLLKFPEAPTAFRAGIARTVFEEQNHLRLYVTRMRKLGVDFGELPVSDYFWNAMSGMKSPLEFVTQMSLTLEQANLDFSLYYQKAVEAVGDLETSAILERVYREEIGHVKHGLTWFNRWRESSGHAETESDWQAYLRLLPPPMTARRAKGIGYFAEPRRLAGFSDEFIRELEVYAGSKGRPPVFWLYNPMCDSEIARGKSGFTPSGVAQRLSRDLEHVPMFAALEQDIVLVHELPRAEWLKQMKDFGFTIPEFRLLDRVGAVPRENKIGGFEPWGWSPEPFERFRPWRDRLIELDGANGRWAAQILSSPDFTRTGLSGIFSKSWSQNYLRSFEARDFANSAGEVASDFGAAQAQIKTLLEHGQTALAKAPYGTSGMQSKRVLNAKELDGPIGGWIKNIIESQGSIVIEPWLDKIADLSIQIEIRGEAVQVCGIRRFLVGPRLEYQGTILDQKLSSLPAEALRFLHSDSRPLEQWKKFAVQLGHHLRSMGYEGPAGLDGMIWRAADGNLRLKPLVELNPRWTMGRIALELENHVAPGVEAAWIFLPVSRLNELQLKFHPPQMRDSGGSLRLFEGMILTSDSVARGEIVTVLVAGNATQSALNLCQLRHN